MTVTPAEAREFTQEETLFLYQFERKVDEWIRATGLGAGDTMAYSIVGQNKQGLNAKARTEIIRRYNVGWEASFVMANPTP